MNFFGLGVETQRTAKTIGGAGQVQTCSVRQMLLQILERFAGQLVAAEGLRRLVEGDFFAQAVRDVAQVGQQRRPVPFEDLGVQFLALSAADAVDEVAEVEPPEVGEAADRSALRSARPAACPWERTCLP